MIRRLSLATGLALTLVFAPLALSQVSDAEFVRGDVNQSGSVNITDSVLIFQVLFHGRDAWVAPCDDALDADDSGDLQMLDGIHIMSYLFLQGPPIPAPATCGADPTPDDDLGCESYSSCDGPSAP